MPFAPNRERALRTIEEIRRRKKAAASGSPQREMVDTIYEAPTSGYILTVKALQGEGDVGSTPAAPTIDPVCAECGGEIYIFSPSSRPYCEAHQHLATELIDAALDAGCTVAPDSVLLVHDLAAEIQRWVMTVYRGGILNRWQEQLMGLRGQDAERGQAKFNAEYRKAQESHAKWTDYLVAVHQADIQQGLSDPRCPLCAVDRIVDKVRSGQVIEQYVAEHGGKARLCAAHSLKIRAIRGRASGDRPNAPPERLALSNAEGETSKSLEVKGQSLLSEPKIGRLK